MVLDPQSSAFSASAVLWFVIFLFWGIWAEFHSVVMAKLDEYERADSA